MSKTSQSFFKVLEEVEAGSEEDKAEKKKSIFFEISKNGFRPGFDDDLVLQQLINDEQINVTDKDRDEWTALQWAVVRNHPEVVKIVFPKVKEKKDKEREEEEKRIKEANANARKLNDLDADFKKPANPALKGEYTPLHWSAYKGLDVISSILIKLGCDPLQVDRTGNNALHQACASNKLSTFKLFMGLGIDLEYKNARSHMPMDLANNKQILDLIKKCLTTVQCSHCPRIFDFYYKKYICSIKDEIVCKDCCKIDFYYENEDSPEGQKDIMDCRCKKCQSEIEKVENDLREAIKSCDLTRVTEQFNISKDYKICEHLKKEARVFEDKLKREKQITELLDSLKVVENHKTIKKSIDTLKNMVDEAIKLHPDTFSFEIRERANHETERLIREREIRRILDNLTLEQASDDNLKELSKIVDDAKLSKVAEEYTDKGEDLVSKMTRNLKAKKLLELFKDYPPREYPEVEEVDPKKKKTQAPPPKKKKKKKEPPFNVPQWATELEALKENVAEFKSYLDVYKEIGLDDVFQKEAKEQYTRFFKKEIPFRQAEEDEKKRIEEEKKAKKAKAKKK